MAIGSFNACGWGRKPSLVGETSPLMFAWLLRDTTAVAFKETYFKEPGAFRQAGTEICMKVQWVGGT